MSGWPCVTNATLGNPLSRPCDGFITFFGGAVNRYIAWTHCCVQDRVVMEVVHEREFKPFQMIDSVSETSGIKIIEANNLMEATRKFIKVLEDAQD